MKMCVYPSAPESCGVSQQVLQWNDLGTADKTEGKSDNGFKSLTEKCETNKTQTKYSHLAFLGLPVRLSFIQTMVFSQHR